MRKIIDVLGVKGGILWEKEDVLWIVGVLRGIHEVEVDCSN